MNEINVIGIDLEKYVFQVCALMNDESTASNRKISRANFLDIMRPFSDGSMIAIKGCATSHYWGRTFQSMGVQIRRIPTQHIKACMRAVITVLTNGGY
jgi:transposase